MPPEKSEKRTSPVVAVPIKLDRLRHLRLTNRALMRTEIRLSQLYGSQVNISEVISKIMKSGTETGFLRFPTTTLVVLLHQGLIHEDADLTEDDVADMTDMMSNPDIIEAVLSAITRQLPEPTVTTNGQGGAAPTATDPTPRSIGSPSGPSDDTTSDSTTKNSGT
jgi:hypothetical protein